MSRAGAVVEVLARALVNEPDGLVVSERTHRGTTLVELELSSDDFGRVIGRQGRTAQAIRTLADLAGEGEGRRVQVEFHERAARGHGPSVG